MLERGGGNIARLGYEIRLDFRSEAKNEVPECYRLKAGGGWTRRALMTRRS